MSLLDVLRSSARSLTRTLRRPSVTARATAPATAPATGRDAHGPAEPSPGQSGPAETVEVDPRRVGPVRMAYSPSTDGDPDPGEIVWTWVPFEERDGRGKDRPVLVVAAERGGTWLAVQLTSKPHGGDAEFVPIGSGPWDAAGRPSWVNLERVFRVQTAGMRREACALGGRPFGEVAGRLQQRYGWR